MAATGLTRGINALKLDGASPQEFMDMGRQEQSKIPRIWKTIAHELRVHFWEKGIYPEKVSLALSLAKKGEEEKLKEILKSIYLDAYLY